MNQKPISLEEQILLAINSLKGMFVNLKPEELILPPDATLESLWAEILVLRREVQSLQKKKRELKPKVEDAVRRLIEDPKLAQIPIPMMAELIREVFISYGLPCNCSSRSLRWYLSQYSLEWDIVRRQLPPC